METRETEGDGAASDPIVVFVSLGDITGTPGIWRALSTTPVTWTERLRDMLNAKGLDTNIGTRIYDMRVSIHASQPGWLFCNAGSEREAHDLFYNFMFKERP